MTTLCVVFALSLGVCLLLTPAVRAVAPRLGLVDRPDGVRKIHLRPVPTGGGIAVLLASAAAIGIALVFHNPFRDELSEHARVLAGLLVGVVVISGIGLLDDVWRLRGRHKLFGQVAAVAVVIACGVVVRRIELFGWRLDLRLAAVPLTGFWLLGAINALNLLDGSDGLLSCAGAILALALAAIALLGAHWSAALIAVALSGSLVGFLHYNRPPATIFLGDAGSMSVGLILGVLAIRSAFAEPGTLPLAAPLAVLAIPILDTAAAVARRWLTGQSVYASDRDHLHHRLLRRGLSPLGVMAWVSLLAMATSGTAILATALHNDLFAVLVPAFVVAGLVASRVFGHHELLLLLGALSGSGGGAAPCTTQATAGERRGGAPPAEWAEFWHAIVRCAMRYDVRSVRLDIHGHGAGAGARLCWDRTYDACDPRLWCIEMPLDLGAEAVARATLIGVHEPGTSWSTIAALARSLAALEATFSAAGSAAQSRRAA